LPLHVQTMDGREIQVSLSGAPIRDRTGRPIGGVLVVRDETEQRRLERWTQDALATLLQMAETLVLPHKGEAADASAFVGTQDMLQATGRLAELTQRVLGCRCVCISAVDQSAAQLQPLAVAGLEPDAERAWRAHVASGVPVGQSILASAQSARLQAGEPLVIAASGLPDGAWPGADGRVVVAPMRAEGALIGLLAVGEWTREPLPNEVALLRSVAQLAAVVVERTQLLQMQASAIRLEELDRIRTEFIAAASHDLQTPLTSIRAGLGLIDASIDAVLAPDERDLLQAVRRNVERLRIRVSALLTANQMDAGALILDCVRGDLRDAALAAVATVQPLFLEKRPTLDVDLPEPLPVVCDPHRLEEVVVNLLANAHRHTPPGTHVTLAGWIQDGEACLRVSDDGSGIPPEDLEAIFARFHRRGLAAGSGLGLSIARSVVELHGGRLWAESEAGRGATFHLRLSRDGGSIQT
jgi:signal transduction histidine kinase